MELVYSKEATTDSTGCYTMLIPEDHEDQVCDAVLVHSPLSNCAKVSPGRDRARVILNCDNGIASNSRFVNSMGFERDEPLAGCANVLKQYQETDNQYQMWLERVTMMSSMLKTFMSYICLFTLF